MLRVAMNWRRAAQSEAMGVQVKFMLLSCDLVAATKKAVMLHKAGVSYLADALL